jgi:ribosomal protein S8
MIRVTNLFNSLKTSYRAKLNRVVIKKTVYVLRVCVALKSLGFVSGFSICKYVIILHLKYRNKRPSIRGIRNVSKSSHRVYLKKNFVTGKGVLGAYKNHSFILFNSSSKGGKILNDIECQVLRVGGEPLVIVN